MLFYIKKNKKVVNEKIKNDEIFITERKANNVHIPYKIVGRRPGDIAECYADPSLANKELNWKTTKTLEDMCKDAYNFTKNRNR